jgi:RNA polymerase sigma-70 factor, ECF subfamily
MDAYPSVLERIAAGDGAAVRECIDRYGRLIWSLARKFSLTLMDAEDAVQEIYLEIWKSASRYDSAAGSESLFITMIARRRLIDRSRAHRRRPQTEEFDESYMSIGLSEEPGEMLLASEVDAAHAALAALDPKMREVLVMGIVEGLTHSEIATRTGRPLGTVKTQMRRGLSRIRSLLEQSGQTDESATK